MKNEEDKFVDFVLSILTDMKIFGKRIPKSNIKTPDIEAVDSFNKYLIEVKVKNQSENEINERNKSFQSGKIFELSRPIKHSNTVDGIFDRAADQIKSFHKSNEYIRIIWVDCTGNDQDFIRKMIKTTLFGMVTLCQISPMKTYECAFFDRSSFLKIGNIVDWVILSYNCHVQSFLSPIIKNDSKLKSSLLYKRLQNSVLDVLESEKLKEILTCDPEDMNLPEHEKINAIMKKYELNQLVVLRPKAFSAEVKIDPSSNGTMA